MVTFGRLNVARSHSPLASIKMSYFVIWFIWRHAIYCLVDLGRTTMIQYTWAMAIHTNCWRVEHVTLCCPWRRSRNSKSPLQWERRHSWLDSRTGACSWFQGIGRNACLFCEESTSTTASGEAAWWNEAITCFVPGNHSLKAARWITSHEGYPTSNRLNPRCELAKFATLSDEPIGECYISRKDQRVVVKRIQLREFESMWTLGIVGAQETWNLWKWVYACRQPSNQKDNNCGIQVSHPLAQWYAWSTTWCSIVLKERFKE